MPRLVLAPIVAGCMALLAGCAHQSDRDTHEQLNAVLWKQSAAEHDIACVQVFELAELRLREALADPDWTAALEQGPGYQKLPPAVIVDVDETLLDNSPHQARQIAAGSDFDQALWKDWVAEARAEPLPGALEFVSHCREAGVRVMFVTNRSEYQDTLRNLRSVFGEQVRDEDLLCKYARPDWTSDKSTRRAVVAQDHRVLLLIGDDYHDFAWPGEAGPEERRAHARAHRERWGLQWILMPNPIYGSWSRAPYGHDRDLPDDEKLRRKHEQLRSDP